MIPVQPNQFAHPALKNYLLDHAYDEMFAGEGELHNHYEPLLEHFNTLSSDELRRRKQSADVSFLNQGITFTVYGPRRGYGAHLSLRPSAAHHHFRRMGCRRAGPHATTYSAQSFS